MFSGEFRKKIVGLWAEIAMFQHCFFADCERFKGFEKKVAEIMVECFTNDIDLCICFVRE